MALIGFLLFSNYRGSSQREKVQIGQVNIWGTLDRSLMEKVLTRLRESNSIYQKVNYIEKSKESYQQDILEALAAGEAPDLILLSNEEIFHNLNKIRIIPYTSFNQRDFLNSYSDAFNIFLSDRGVLAFPFIIDPMVMYYNRSIFKTAAVPLPPKH